MMAWFCMLTAMLGFTLAGEIRSGNSGFIWQVWRRWTIGMFAQAGLVLAATVAVGLFIYDRVPFTRIGWWSGLATLIHFVQHRLGHATPTAVATQAHWIDPMAIVIMAVAVTVCSLAFPFTAHREETSYRALRNNWRTMSPTCVRFAFMHLIMGIPIATAIALIVPAFYFGWRYLRAYWNGILRREQTSREAMAEAVMDSTAAHALYNTLVACMIFGFIVVSSQ